jgi:predicted MPP superfamily phosphohydrolase
MTTSLVSAVIKKTLGVTGAALVYAHLETRWFEVKHVTVPILPPGQSEIRILQLADLHYLPSQKTKTKWLTSLGQLKPDLVINTGDNVASVASVPALLQVLRASGLFEVPGVFVGGSNDYYAPVLKNPAKYLSRKPKIRLDLPPLPWRDLFAGFEAGGWTDLNNKRALVSLADGRELSFVGTDDAHHDKEQFPEPLPIPSSAAAHIGVTHAPYQRVLQAFKDDDAALVVAGHTHGGQLRIPGFGALVTNCDLDRGRAEGLHGWPGARPDSPAGKDSIWLYVSAGAGTSPYTPFRFDCRPSATALTLPAITA